MHGGHFLFINFGDRLTNALVTDQHQGDNDDPFEFACFPLQKYAHRLDAREANGDVVVWDSWAKQDIEVRICTYACKVIGLL